MREIKFRGKRIDNDEWAYGSLSASCSGDRAFIIQSWDYTPDYKSIEALEIIEVDPTTVGQFTGLQDKHGNDLHERDTYKYLLRSGKYETGKIIYDRGCFKCIPDGTTESYCLGSMNKEVEIIGNIHTKDTTPC